MKRLMLILVIAFVFSTTAMAVEIAISTQAKWWTQEVADREMQEIADNVTAVSVEQFTADQQDALADWVVAHTGDDVSDLLILCGQFPDTIYKPGNAQIEDSLAELFLDDGNTIVNTGDYMFFVVNGAGTNDIGGLQAMMDIADITMWEDDTAVVVTADGQDITPTLVDFVTDRPFHLDELEGNWYAELVLAQNDAGTRADPVIVANAATGGRLGIFYQTSYQDDDPRGEVISEWINNWYFKNVAEPGNTIPVEPNGDIAAANEQARAGDTIEIAAGTYILSSQIEIKDGVTYRGAGQGLTILDGNHVTRAFAGWGDRSVANGQIDENGNVVPNNTGPKGWVLEGMTIQNCVADSKDRQDILSSARDLLNNYTGTPYTLVTAQEENGGIAENPDAFELLSGGADDDLTDVELQAYLDANPVGSAGHLVLDDDKSRDGGAIFIGNGAAGTIQNCDFLNNSTPVDGDDGGAINVTGRSTVTINDCLFNGNYACSPDSVSIDGADGDAGHIKAQGNNLAGGFIEVGTTLVINRCVFINGNAEDDAGAIQANAQGIVIRIDSCWFEGNTAWDNGTVLQFSNEDQHEATVTNCVFMKNITKSDNSPDRMIETRRNSKFVNCTFVGNVQEDQDLIYNNADDADSDDDGTDDEFTDTTQVVNCIFVNNVVGNGDDVLGSRNNNFTIAATNCLFFGNTLQNGDPADNTQRPDVETGSILSNPMLDANLVPMEGSEAIDGGVNPAAVGVTLTNDYNGAGRPEGAGYDIGAFEVVVEPKIVVFDFETDAQGWGDLKDGTATTVVGQTHAGGGSQSLRATIDEAANAQQEGGWAGPRVFTDDDAAGGLNNLSFWYRVDSPSFDGGNFVLHWIMSTEAWSGGGWYGNGLWGVVIADGQWHQQTADLSILGANAGGWEGTWGDQTAWDFRDDLLYSFEIAITPTDNTNGSYIYIDDIVFSSQ